LSANLDRPMPASLPPRGQLAYRIELSLTVADASALWSAALDRALAQPGAAYDDAIEVLGPSEDPDLSACLAMLTAPAAVAGCSLDDYEVVPVQVVPQAPANDYQLARKAVGSV
jgi:hypothetical protein